MRRFLLPLVGLLALGVAIAGAQNITRSIQLSQDPTGPIGFDTLNNVYLPGKLLVPRTTPPVLSTCGTSPSILGNDTVGKVTTGSALTTCTITFATAYAVAPACFLQAQGGATQPTYTTSTTAITATVTIASTVYNYFCVSQG